jgi:hypothetical protein
MASTLPDEGLPLPASTNDMACSASFPMSPEMSGWGEEGGEGDCQPARYRKFCALTLGHEQRVQLEKFRTRPRQLVLQKDLGTAVDVQLCLQ